MSVKSYAPDKVAVIIAGVPLTGFADGTFVTVSRNSDTFTPVIGADGEVARTKSSDRSGTIVVTLMQSSNGNDLLSGLHVADEASMTGAFPAAITDTEGRTVLMSDTCWIQKPADSEYGKELGSREWTIYAANLNIFVGGN